MMLAKEYGFSKIFCLDVNEYRLNFAQKFAITKSIKSTDVTAKQQILDETENRGVDVAIVATSNLQALSDAIGIVRKGGTVVMFGVPSKGDTLEMDMSEVYSKEITIVTSYAASDNDTKEAMNLISSSSGQCQVHHTGDNGWRLSSDLPSHD